ncbi:hypothetical protein GTP38_23330 [Duganella sp. FT94W]|uniref:Uncharacterized protein n=1 Tax=Duganella lactea TaxID=2692173 RepID=A0ABW9VCT9_9BURK|nr:hypothetical protein [Duganella lactea]MYM37263.1 hypothetical protein [Duganella lactea]
MNQAVNTAVANVAFNIADFEASDTAWLEVQTKKDDGPLLFNGEPVRILLRSPGTKEAMSAQHKVELANTNRMYAAMRGKQANETVESKVEQATKKLLAVTVQIDNFPISAQELYSNPKLGYITEQVTKFHSDWANF